MAILNEEVLKRVFNGMTFSRRQASAIVGGRYRLERLVGDGSIRAVKNNADAQNGKWQCNGWDVLKYATVK